MSRPTQPMALFMLSLCPFWVAASTISTTLTVSPPTLALSVNNTAVNAALTGNARHFTITNTGSTAATGITVGAPNPSLPATTYVTTCGATLAPNATCTITLTPGAIVSAGAGAATCNTGIAPIASVFSIGASNAATITAGASVLSYGCIYQGGYIYSIDDTTPATGSIGGKVAATSDQAAAFPSGILWSSNGSSFVDFTTILGIYDPSTNGSPSITASPYPAGTPAYKACNGISDGACNTDNIVSYYNANRVAGGAAPTPLTQYAAGLCKASINGYSDWYLPAICEMGPASKGSGCPAVSQNMVSNLSFLLGNAVPCKAPPGCLAGGYWSSTEFAADPKNGVWGQVFGAKGSYQYGVAKDSLVGVRCSRALK